MIETDIEGSTVLVVDDTPANISILLDFLGQGDFRVLVAEDGESALEQIEHAKPDLILLDVMMPGLDGHETCRMLKESDETRDIPVIFMTALSEVEDKVLGFELGAVDYITKPFQHEEVLARVRTHLAMRDLQSRLEEANANLEKRVAQRTAELSEAFASLENLKKRLQEENRYLQEEIKREHNFDQIVGSHSSIVDLMQNVKLVAPTDSTVLINGETGTGKELIARAIHELSCRGSRALVTVNCGAISAGLVESELFGHERGSFTGATQRRQGRFELADGGSLFLDEVGELPPETQVKLLRVLQEQEFERVGGSATIKVDVRVIAATNRNLAKAVSDGAFRSDLYYRLNVFPLDLPPLRDRKSDITGLVDYFLKKISARLRKSITGVSEEALVRLMQYSWPGNVRELENCIERAVILARSEVLDAELLSLNHTTEISGTNSLDQLEVIEKDIILEALRKSGWKVGGENGAASILDRPPSTVRDRIRKLGIEKP